MLGLLILLKKLNFFFLGWPSPLTLSKDESLYRSAWNPPSCVIHFLERLRPTINIRMGCWIRNLYSWLTSGTQFKYLRKAVSLCYRKTWCLFSFRRQISYNTYTESHCCIKSSRVLFYIFLHTLHFWWFPSSQSPITFIYFSVYVCNSIVNLRLLTGMWGIIQRNLGYNTKENVLLPEQPWIALDP